MSATPSPAIHTNRLIHEKSPYLLQHAHNPVDWYPWGPEAFEKARQEDKPILLSIGYSTCHWCHVMAHESFENAEIAELMNRWFVSIKVDREEHPDVDHIYMSAVTRLAGQGGWPLTVFLTPDLKPFYGGTYFPPERRWQMAGMRELLPAVAQAWSARREELVTSSEQLTAALQPPAGPSASADAITPALLEAAFNQAVGEFDAAHGGFGAAPKFPRPHELSFLLRYAARRGSAQARQMAETTLEHLARGGIHDHLGGGFHRYSTDAEWLVPHFEKMLYDQALLALAYLDAYRLTRRPLFAQTARGIFEYVRRDLTDPHGGFYSAEDADSEGEEGKFYVWSLEEIRQALGPEEGARFAEAYGVTAGGNFSAEGGGGKSILHLPQQINETQLASARQRLLDARSRRLRPHRDDKILASWNGLMIAAFANGAAALDEPQYLDAARRAAAFVWERLTREDGPLDSARDRGERAKRVEPRLLRRYRDGEARYPGTLEDYAFLSDGLLELYEAGGETVWLSRAVELAEAMIQQFWDEEGGGFFLRDKEQEPLIVRAKEIYDGATPSGNSIAVGVLARLGRLTANQRFEQLSRRALEAFSAPLAQAPFGFPQMFSALDFALGPTQEIVIAGPPSDAGTQRLLREVRRRFLPRAVLIHKASTEADPVESLVPYVKTQGMVGGRPTAYVCQGYVCALPATSVEALAAQLDHTAQPVGAP
ncbi:MAG: thioredoxin domain-containing protein [Candidatus Omnitrophica bacterium]|nr:thioredoxin domain-containing protein [Candidatus Omnitrophota bacterium]